MTVLVTGAAGFIGSNYVFYHLAAHPEDKLTYAGNLSTLAPVMDRIPIEAGDNECT